MLKHEFGIMPEKPESGQTFKEYEPEKYDCITVDDDCVLAVAKRMKRIKCYWHSLDRPEAGLAYYGITLIPPESMGGMREIVKDLPGMEKLVELLERAEKEEKYVIHFGV